MKDVITLDKAKHTPGPWKLGKRGKYRVQISAPTWEAFAKVVVAMRTEPIQPSSEGEANARLIAAAPEAIRALLTALREQQRALRELDCAYVRMLESARDRIIDLDGMCDAVDVMERNDADLKKARATLQKWRIDE